MSGREESPLDANQFMAVMNPNQKRKLGLQIGMKHTPLAFDLNVKTCT